MTVKQQAVRLVKPRVSEHTWSALRTLANRGAAQPRRPSLTDLAIKFETDKWGHHFYPPHYERHFAHLRDESFTLFEIGIGGYRKSGRGGASLRMWEEFFPKARIVGLDIVDKSFVDGGRVRTYQGSQTDPAVLDRILADFPDIKIIVDDGSHRPEHIRASFAHLFSRLPDDGIYAIEDTQTSYWPAWGGSELLDDPSTTMALVKDLLDGLNWEEFAESDYQPTYTDLHVKSLHAYHNLVILEKGDNREGSRPAKRRIEGSPPAPPVAEQRRPYSALTPPTPPA